MNKKFIVTTVLRVRSLPVITKDNEVSNIVNRLNKGQEVSLISEKDRWFEVEYNINGSAKKGWVYSEFLIPKVDQNEIVENKKQNNSVVFTVGTPNLWNSANTIKVREIIKDEFTGGKNKWDLQCTEYVCFKIKQLGIDIKWPVKQGRHGGKWADIFNKYKLYKVSETPKNNCAMCFTAGLEKTSARDTGHIAFVENVLDDGSIYISEANWPGSGKYNLRKMLKPDWRNKYKARFVDFT